MIWELLYLCFLEQDHGQTEEQIKHSEIVQILWYGDKNQAIKYYKKECNG